MLAVAVSWFSHFVLLYNLIRLQVRSPTITALSEKLPTRHGEPRSCVALTAMSHILVPRDLHDLEIHLSERWFSVSQIIRIVLALRVNL
jgi:hypothetical protein